MDPHLTKILKPTALAIVALCAAGCARVVPAPNSPVPGAGQPDHLAAPGADTPAIVVERIEPGRWRATYVFPHPVTGLRFERDAAGHRERVWRIVTPGYRWASDSTGVRLEQASGSDAPTSRIVFEMPEFSDHLPKEYELFQRFSDGAAAFYTGHFYATPAGPAYPGRASSVRRLRVIVPRELHAVVRGRVDSGTVAFTDSIGDGTYIYVGTAAPIETPHLVAVVDPGMPTWLREMFDRQLPALFAAYDSGFATPLPWKPVVLYSYDGSTDNGYESGGGTLTGLISMAVRGSAWRTPSDDAAVQAFWLLAHEAAHLWNGQLAGNPGDSQSWMHEGSADAMANALLLRFGVVDSGTWRSRQEAAINSCATLVGDASMRQAFRRGSFRTYYDCGFVMALWTEAALRQTAPGSDLFTFWRDLVASAIAAGRRYDEARYFRVAADAGVRDSTIATMRAFLEARSIGPAVQGLVASGVAIAPGRGTPPREYQDMLALEIVKHLMSVACNRYSFNFGDPIVTQPVAGCEPFAQQREVFAVEGFRLRDQSVAAYDMLARQCSARGDVRVQGRDGGTLATVQCTRAPRERPVWYQLR